MNDAGRDLKAGVIGTGSLGTNHTRLYCSSERTCEVYVYDISAGRAAEIAGRFGAEVCDDVDDLLSKVDIVSVCTPATDHFDTVMRAFRAGVHVLVEKPVASTSAEGEGMVEEADRLGLNLQVGHIERFNGTFRALDGLLDRPMFIESHRLGTFTPRGIDVSVVVDLMIHDIDIVLNVLRGDRLVDLRASGAGVLTGSPDIVNARLEFESGCVANLTASRISREPMRKMRFFQPNMYISADFRARELEAFSRADDVSMETLALDPTAFIRRVEVDVDKSEPLMCEIESFIDSVLEKREPSVTGRQGLEALKVAEQVLRCLDERKV